MDFIKLISLLDLECRSNLVIAVSLVDGGVEVELHVRVLVKIGRMEHNESYFRLSRTEPQSHQEVRCLEE
ncbi:hypothetical protein TNCT_131951 [Trichonephila clavata]|uniref:Uncharacterized protein n=1 Tax=Trichonephila clavata TaxID=2740835 RepID=A0A8X6KU07_TRICU|nr:hypothetical protein TNCT_131951 [Trichonephila clavata]